MPSSSGGKVSADQNAACADSERMESSQLYDSVRRVMREMWWREGFGIWLLMISPGFLTWLPAVRIADGRVVGYGSSGGLTSSTAANSTSLASCSFAWCWQKRSSAPEGSLARTRAAAPHRSHRSALVSSGLVKVAFMATPFWPNPTVSNVGAFGLLPRGFTRCVVSHACPVGGRAGWFG